MNFSNELKKVAINRSICASPAVILNEFRKKDKEKGILCDINYLCVDTFDSVPNICICAGFCAGISKTLNLFRNTNDKILHLRHYYQFKNISRTIFKTLPDGKCRTAHELFNERESALFRGQLPKSHSNQIT